MTGRTWHRVAVSATVRHPGRSDGLAGGRSGQGQYPGQSHAVGEAARGGDRPVRRQGGADARQLVRAAQHRPGRLDRGRQGRGNAQQARHQQQAGVRRLLPARGVLRAAEGQRQQRRRDAGPVRDPDPELLRQEARSPRVRRILQPDAAQGDRLQACRRVADVRHLLPRAAVRRRRQGSSRRPVPPCTRTAS